MSEYRRLNFEKLNFAPAETTFEEALASVTLLNIPDDVLSEKNKMKITKVEKDYKNKCVKLEISY